MPKNLKRLLAIGVTITGLVSPLSAEISFSSLDNPNANFNLAKKALQRLASDPKLVNHPIHHYRIDPNLKVKIIFDNQNAADGANVINHNEIHLKSGESFEYYLVNLAHEFVHIGMIERYGDTNRFSFLAPEDFALINLMEEAFANGLSLWLHLTYPEIPSNREIRYWRSKTKHTEIADAMRNDYLAIYPQLSEEAIIEKVAGEMVNLYMTGPGIYPLVEIPQNMAVAYGKKNTVLIQEYKVYRDRSIALLDHIWKYLASIMPFKIPGNRDSEYYRSTFLNWVMLWSSFDKTGKTSIFYWVKYDAAGNARARLAAVPERERYYDYLPQMDEVRLNRVMKEIDPFFTPFR
jgi:hypothetical protein